jgi:hypothetical protein
MVQQYDENGRTAKEEGIVRFGNGKVESILSNR